MTVTRLITANGLQYTYDGQNKRVWTWNGQTDGSGNPAGFSVSMYSPAGQKLATYQLTPQWLQGWTPAMWMQVTLVSSDQYFGGRRWTSWVRRAHIFRGARTRGARIRRNTWSFATYWRDSGTNLDYANNRYYSNAYGRFMSPDPSGDAWDPSNPQSWNSYAYVLGDPTNSNDPDGLDCSSTPFYFNGEYQGTIGDVIAAQSDVSILATAMYTESGHGKGVDVSDEEYSIGAVIMN